MIDRDISDLAIAALNGGEINAIALIEIDTASGPVRAHTGLGERPFMGHTYLGVGEFGGVSDVTEANRNAPNTLNLTLRVLDPNIISEVANEPLEGRDVAVHLATLDDERVIAHEVPYIFDGHVSRGNVKRGDIDKGIPHIIRISCSDWLERWNQPPLYARTTSEAQKHLHPGDRIFDLTEIIAGSPLSSLPMKRDPRNTRAGGVGGGTASSSPRIANP